MREKGQIQIVVILLSLIGVLLILHFTGLLGGGKPSESIVEEGTEASGEDTVAPLRSNLFPSGILPADTTETTISVSTNEPSYCRYSEESDQDYNSIKDRFTYDKTKTFHTAKVKKLKAGETYEFYVRCRDMEGNRNISDAVIQFSVGGTAPSYSSGYPPIYYTGPDETPPMRIDLFPNGTLPPATTETTISVSTNEPSYCRYSEESGQDYSSIQDRFTYDKEKLLHTAKVKGLIDNKIYEYFVRCRDMEGNVNTSDAIIRFGVGGIVLPSGPDSFQDIYPPYRFDGFPTEDLPYYTKKTTISLKTDEEAVCRYSTVSGMSYGSMNRIFSNTGGTFHSTEVTALSEGEEYKYYIKCADENDNKNTDDFIISFEVEEPEDLTPPVRYSQYPTGDVLRSGTTETIIGISTNEPAYCRYSTKAGTSYSSMRSRLYGDEIKQYHTATVEDLESGKSYDFFVRGKDLSDNVNTGDIRIYFSIE